MNAINGNAALVSGMRELANSRPIPSIADIVGNPDPTGPEVPAPAEFTDKYEMQALVNAFRSNADQALTLIDMLDGRR